MGIEKGKQLEKTEKIVNSPTLQNAVNDELSNNLENAEKRKAEIINKFFNQPFFRWEQSLIDALLENNPNINFDDIKNEWVNLAVLKYCNQMFNFKYCLNKTQSCIKSAFMDEIYEKIISEIGTDSPYDDFKKKFEKKPSSLDCMSYLQNIIYYLDSKEPQENEKPEEGKKLGKKVIDILKNITITNNDINNRLKDEERLPADIPLSDPKINSDIKKSFDMLLAFEVWTKADRIIDLANDISNQFANLFWNAIPAVNTIITEHPEYRYDEEKFLKEKKDELEVIASGPNISLIKKEREEELRWAYYIDDLKKKNKTIGNALEQLHKKNFDYDKIDKSVLQSYLKAAADIRLKTILNSDIASALKIDCINIDDFSDFYRKLVDINDNYITLDSTRWIRLRVKKTIIPWEHPQLNNLNTYKVESEYSDVMPISYEIKKSDIDSLNIDIEDRIKLLNFLSKVENKDGYVIKWKNIGMLIYLFYIINSSPSITTLNPESQKEVENLFWKINSTKDEEWENAEDKEDGGEKKDKNEDDSKKDPEEWDKKQKDTVDVSEKKEDMINEFIKEVEGFWNWTKFENWAEIWMPMWESELPWWWYQWMKVKIDNIDKKRGKFTWRVFWWELKFNSKLEWKIKTFDMNKNSEDWQNLKKLSRDSNKIRLLPDPTKDSFNTFKDKKLNGKLWTWTLQFPDWVKWDGNKFVGVGSDWKDELTEIKCFWKKWDDKVSYRVDYNQSKKTFKVSSTFNWEEKWKDWKSEKKHFSYSREMDWNNFLIFFTQKWLTPQTETESKVAGQKLKDEIKIYNKNKLNITWFSINTIKNVIKWKFGEIKKWLEEYNKKQEEKLGDILVEDWWLRNLLWNTVWKFSPSLKETFVNLEQKHYNERDNRARAKIEPFYKQFCADYDLADTFDQEPPYIKMQWKWSLKDQVLDRVRNAKDVMWDPWIYQAAGLLLANIEKWWSPYRWLSWYENEGLWVKALMGNAHYKRFLEHKKECIKQFEIEKNTDKLQDQLANSEMIYITDNIFWRNKWLLFGAWVESRWLKENPEGTNYMENPSKKILSEQFAKKLDDLTKDRFNKDSVIGKMPKHNYFEKSEKDFYRLITSSRFPDAMAELEWMISLARTDSQIYTTKKCYLLVMLSGILDFNWNKSMRKFAYTQWKTLWFAPAMLAKNVGHSEEIASLLDDFSKWDFSKNVTAYCHKKDLVNGKTNIPILSGQLNDWFTEDKMKQFDEFIESIPWRNRENKSAALRKLKDDLIDYDNQNPDDIILRNAKFINSAWLNASADAVDTRLIIDESWQFKWKDQDEKSDMSNFWKSCADKIEKAKETLDWPEWANYANQMLDKYLWWFWISWDNKQSVYKRINTAYHYKNTIEEENKKNPGRNSDPIKWKYCNVSQKDVKTINEEWKTVTIPLVPLWRIYESDINKILKYWIEWFVRTHSRLWSRQLPQQLKRALDEFQKFFEKAFKKNYFSDISKKIYSENKIFNLWWWSVYETTIQKNNNGNFYLESDDNTISSNKDSILFNELPNWKKKKSVVKSVFDGDNYGNSEMNNMRQSLKKHWVSLDDERSLFNDSSVPAESQQEYS